MDGRKLGFYVDQNGSSVCYNSSLCLDTCCPYCSAQQGFSVTKTVNPKVLHGKACFLL